MHARPADANPAGLIRHGFALTTPGTGERIRQPRAAANGITLSRQDSRPRRRTGLSYVTAPLSPGQRVRPFFRKRISRRNQAALADLIVLTSFEGAAVRVLPCLLMIAWLCLGTPGCSLFQKKPKDGDTAKAGSREPAKFPTGGGSDPIRGNGTATTGPAGEPTTILAGT